MSRYRRLTGRYYHLGPRTSKPTAQSHVARTDPLENCSQYTQREHAVQLHPHHAQHQLRLPWADCNGSLASAAARTHLHAKCLELLGRPLG
jgi:hypothetical protein